MKLERNKPCPCGSGKKYKQCCFLDAFKKSELMRALRLAKDINDVPAILARPLHMYRFKTTLLSMFADSMEEEISRTFEMSGHYTLADLHSVIQRLFDWDDDHMYAFYMNNKLFDSTCEYKGAPSYAMEEETFSWENKRSDRIQIRDLGISEGHKFLYCFDFGDEILHEIVLEQTRPLVEGEPLTCLINETGTPPSQYPYSDTL
jgi:hypothetical protein